MIDDRPNPDALLARVKAEESSARRGKLKIFFGYAAGVGKTYAMLRAAQREKASGIDVVVGYVEPHGRPETEALLEGLEQLPTQSVMYRGVPVREFDLDAALARHPQLMLVDELAHTNLEGSRHAKRWQDVEELLADGIDVYTTLNVQHVESLNDIIAQITGVTVRETLPDLVLEHADEIELIDLTPEELMDRLREGKVYIPQQAERALQNFFQRANLAALREMSLRQAAQRLSKDVEAARQLRSAEGPWATSERLLVCVGPSPMNAKLIRTARRMAAAFGSEWLAVTVESPGAQEPSSETRERLAQNLQLAERLGAETHTLVGSDVARTLVDFARSRNVTKIVVGKTAQPRWKRLLFGTVVDALLEYSGDIDVYVIRSEPDAAPRRRPPSRSITIDWNKYLSAAAIVAGCTAVGWAFQWLGLSETNIVMVFLVGVVAIAARYGRGPATAAAVVSVLVFDFFFVPPHFTFAVTDAEYGVTFAVMLMIGLIISALTARIANQLRSAQQIERRTAALFRLTRQLGQVAGQDFLVRIAGQQLRDIFDGEAVVFVREGKEPIELRFGQETSVAKTDINPVVAQWVADHDEMAGVGTDTLPNATALFVPLIGSQGTLGAIGAKPNDLQRFADPEQRRLLETCASLIALSLERDRSVLEAHDAQLQVQAEQLRNSLLNSVSHDLRTPLAAIAGAASSLLEATQQHYSDTQRELLQSIVDESKRLARLVDNLLDMTRLESGGVHLNKQWHVLEEIIGSALSGLRRDLERHTVRVDLPPELPLLNIDGVLLEQVFFNLLENAARYTPAGSQIEILASCESGRLQIRVADDGQGIAPGTESRVFDKFFRGATPTADGRRGVGLGLAICHAIVEAHGGRIVARNRPGGGAEFVITLPCEERAPDVALDTVSVRSST